jgi:hypothetical protein
MNYMVKDNVEVAADGRVIYVAKDDAEIAAYAAGLNHLADDEANIVAYGNGQDVGSPGRKRG